MFILNYSDFNLHARDKFLAVFKQHRNVRHHVIREIHPEKAYYLFSAPKVYSDD